jgi:DNA polymerase zeta
VDARHSRRYVAGSAAWHLLTLFDMQAIRVIESTDKWGSKVVYGDTDSLFIYMPGKTKEQAFRIGNDIADTITALNPAPIKLKFEKVIFMSCVLGGVG